MLVTSRAMEEYVAMFALGAAQLQGSVLDCSAGAAGFVAAVNAGGGRAVAVDPAYALPRAELAAQTNADLARSGRIAAEFPDRFTWSWYGEPARRDALRRRAVGQFLADLVTHPEHYVAAALPQLPFADHSFDLAVCSHLLFTWADQLGIGWHLAALQELARVAREVRVFPTVLQGAGEPVPFFAELMEAIAAAGLRARLCPVDYEFQVGADRMLVLS